MESEITKRAIDQFAAKFRQNRVNHCKLRALTNYSEVADFRERTHLKLLKTCYAEGFLCAQEEQFLDHLVGKYEVNYLDWTYRNPWLRHRMTEMRRERRLAQEKQQLALDFSGCTAAYATPVAVPVELLQPVPAGWRRAHR